MSLRVWALGGILSVLAHLGAGWAVMAALTPPDTPEQPSPKARLDIQSLDVSRREAVSRRPEYEEKAPEAPTGEGVTSQPLDRRAALPRDTGAERLARKPVPARPIGARDAPSVSAPIAAQPIASVTATPQVSESVSAKPVQSVAAPAARPMQVASLRSQPVRPTTVPQQTALITAPQAKALEPTALPASAGVPSATTTQLVPPPQSASPNQSLDPEPVALREPPQTALSATLAFPRSGAIDPVSLAAFESFTSPATAEAAEVKDALSAALNRPCARMQVIFDPETVTLTLTGHVPMPEDRAPVLDALRARMGADIEVRETLAILPAPQCGALAGIDALGLPQSTDQITNPLIVGPNAQARSFRYLDGAPLQISLEGPDYPAYVYLDYFDAGGNVVHLSPNDRSALKQLAPEEPVTFGAASPDEPGLFVRIGPPYGQEIAVAFASSAPLYEGLRPIVEPAEPYLLWLSAQVARARAEDPEFKGEWVYFFVETAAR